MHTFSEMAAGSCVEKVPSVRSQSGFRFQLAGQRIELRGDLLRFAFGPHGLFASGRMGTAARE
jgi:hypothetical protein